MKRCQIRNNFTRAGLAAALTLGTLATQTTPAAAQFLPLRSWGSNFYGQLGNGATAESSNSPQTITTPDNVTALAAGYNHSMMLRIDGTVWAWGDNSRGELGYTANPLSLYAKQCAGITNARGISAGAYTSYAVRNDSTVWAWGNSFSGQLGNGIVDNAAHQTPTQVQVGGGAYPPLSNVATISAGYNHCLALLSSGSVYAWGNNFFGQLGGNSTTNSSRAIPVGIFGVTQIAGGGYHSLALKTDGTVWAWGSNDHGQLGDGTRTNRSNPVQVPGLNNVAAIAAAAQCSVVLKRDGTIWVWGFFSGTTDAAGTVTPFQVSGFYGMKRFAVGAAHILAVDSNDDLYVYGSNARGQLGNPFVDYQSFATKLAGLYHISAVSAGPDFSLVATFAAGVSGLIHLQGISPNATPQVISLTFNSPDNTPFVRYVTASADAFIQVENLPRRNYTVQIKSDKWLSRTVNLDLRNNNSTDLDVTLLAGDSDGDNVVDVADLLQIIYHYNKVSTDADYLDAADFNCDGANDVTDLLMVIANYNQQGE